MIFAKTKKGTIIAWIVVALIIFILFIGLHIFIKNKTETKVTIDSALMELSDMAELTTSEFKFRGIAKIYKDDEKKKVDCHVCYDALVKSGVDTSKITYEKDDENKVLTLSLPEMDLNISIVDEESMKFLPAAPDVELDALLKSCLEDAKSKSENATALKETAVDNTKSLIEGFLYPFLESEGYTLAWK